MFRTQTPLRLILGLGLCSLGGAMLYIYFKNKEDEDDNVDTVDAVAAAATTANNKQQEQIIIQLVVSNEIVPVLIGRSGANLKIIEDKTGTVIRFREKDDIHHYCEIRGTKPAAMKAKEMIMKEIQKSPTVKEEIFVPQSACGKIIGRCGEALQEICRKSLAKVSVDSGDRGQSNVTRRVVITGNRTQVNTARKLIEEKVKEDEEYRKSVEQIEQKREPRRSPTNSVSSNHSSMTSSINSYLPPGEKLSMMNNDGAVDKPLEVYVSAIASPAKFWLQLVGPQSRKLDELVEQMTEYYGTEDNQQLHKIADPYLGQIVAALFKYDGKWYRAEIVGILPNEYNPRDVVLDLYFVDYGDSEYVAPHEVFELRTDFLTLRFQAIECFLANVKPAISNEQDNTWDQQSITKFEELTHVASWKKLVSRVVTSKERPKGRNHGKREGSPIPGVELFDTSGEIEINIAHALIAEGVAVSDYQNTEKNNVLRLGGGDFNKIVDSPHDMSFSSSSSAATTTPASSSQIGGNNENNSSLSYMQKQQHDVEDVFPPKNLDLSNHQNVDKTITTANDLKKFNQCEKSQSEDSSSRQKTLLHSNGEAQNSKRNFEKFIQNESKSTINGSSGNVNTSQSGKKNPKIDSNRKQNRTVQS